MLRSLKAFLRRDAARGLYDRSFRLVTKASRRGVFLEDLSPRDVQRVVSAASVVPPPAFDARPYIVVCRYPPRFDRPESAGTTNSSRRDAFDTDRQASS
jgi:hypothetical protein